MRMLGEICLLVSLIATGYAAFLSTWRRSDARDLAQRLVVLSALLATVALSIVMAILIWALAARDFRFDYVAQYCSRMLSWQYRVSALWVGQAGSLLLWTWMTSVLAILLRLLPAADARLRNTAFGLMMGNVFFLVIVLVFAANPMARSPILADEGAGLSPLLQHPSMLIHPPIVFLAYACWSAPCALALAALVCSRLDAAWTQMARPWALSAWALLGVGLLLGAHWAYQELGWGGYWGWDPVENGSLLPWLTGTAFIHSMMVWRHRDGLKRTALILAVLTFALCNFATFLTRSGIFSSVHAFSESPIGWLFLALMGALLVAGMTLLFKRRELLHAQRPPVSLMARDSLILVSNLLLLVFAAVVLVGTLVAPLSKTFTGRVIQVGPDFYNNVLPPIGLLLLAMTAIVPLLQWGGAPTTHQRRLLMVSIVIGAAAGVGAFAVGVRHPLALAVCGLAAMAVASLVVAFWLDTWRRATRPRWHGFMSVLKSGRRKYAAYFVHLGFVCLAVGVTGSSLGTQREEVTLDEGEQLRWGGRDLRYVRLEQRQLPDKLVAEAVLVIQNSAAAPIELRPARHLHLLQNEWTTEVAVHSTWAGDFYTVLNAGLGEGRVALTLVSNPMIRWIWFGGCVMTLSVFVSLWPTRRRHAASSMMPTPVRLANAA